MRVFLLALLIHVHTFGGRLAELPKNRLPDLFSVYIDKISADLYNKSVYFPFDGGIFEEECSCE